jgi:predicted enzyme related to lactoylglutathione lyase
MLISFFEIPAVDFDRAVTFYEKVFDVSISRCDCGEEQMGFFPDPDEGPRGSISKANGFNPSSDGTMVSFLVDDLDSTLQKVTAAEGICVMPKTKISDGGAGYFAIFKDTEGNRVGLHARG